MNFDLAFNFIIKFEQGYVDNPKDKGGPTKYGISERAYPDEDIRGLTLSRAREIYKRDYWDKLNLDAFPDRIRLALFDSGVNCGVISAIRFLQQALLVGVDGKIGPDTLAALDKAVKIDTNALLADILWWRYRKLAITDSWNTFGNGWTRRMMNVIAES